MRNLIYVALVGLLILLVLPGAVSAANSNTVNITGSVGSYGSISIEVQDNNMTYGAMTRGLTYIQGTYVNVTATYPNWWVDAKDMQTTAPAYRGYMMDMTDEIKTLATPFLLGRDSIEWKNLTDDNGWMDYMTGTPGTYSQYANFKQTVNNYDSEGNYSITVTFVGGPY